MLINQQGGSHPISSALRPIVTHSISRATSPGAPFSPALLSAVQSPEIDIAVRVSRSHMYPCNSTGTD